MALIPACIFLCFAALSVQAEETSVTPQPPDILLGPLFNDVQNAKLFPDQKPLPMPCRTAIRWWSLLIIGCSKTRADLIYAISLTSISPCRKRARNMFRQRGNHCANILTDFGGINAFYRKHRKMGFSITAAKTLCRARRTFSRGILLGQLLHHVRTCRKRSLG